MSLLSKVRIPLMVTAAILVGTPVHADTTQMRFLSQFLPTAKQYPSEKAALDAINADQSLGVKVKHLDYDGLGLKHSDGLRLVRRGTFDVVTVQIGNAARDDAFLEGLDLIGVSTNMNDLRNAVDSYRNEFDARLQDKFQAKVLGLWPFGPQVFYCNQEINSVSDLKGLKVRSFTPSMSALLESFGATPVTLSFPEVYPALQRGVADCGVTSPTSGNSGKWPEVTTHQIPLSVSGSVQGYFASLKWWNSLSKEQQTGIEAAFKKLENSQWETAVSLNEDAIACNTGQDSCGDTHQKFSMKLVEVNAADQQRVKEAAESVILPDWVERCESTYADCGQVWNSTVGKARDMVAKAKQ